MEKVWELVEGQESYGSARGGIGRETVQFRAKLDKGGYYYFACSLPFALNKKGSLPFERLKIQKSMLLKRWSNAKQSRFSVDVTLHVFNEYQTIFKKTLVLDMADKEDQYECFEVPSGFVPAEMELTLEGHSFVKKLHCAAELCRYGTAPHNPKENAKVARMGQFLMTRTMNKGMSDYDTIMKAERTELMTDIHDFGVFGPNSNPSQNGGGASPGSVGVVPGLSSPEGMHRSASLTSTRSHNTMGSIYEVQAEDAIGDAMFYLLDKGVLSAPVWSPADGAYLGMFDIQDAMHFTLKLRDLSKSNKKHRRGDLLVHGITVGETESSSWFGLDLPVSIFFREANRKLAPWVPLTISSPMTRVLERLSDDTQRIPVVDHRGGKVIKVISQSEIINQVFHRFIAPKLEPHKRDYFETCELNEAAIEESVHVFSLDDGVLRAFWKIMSSIHVDAVPVVDEKGKVVASITPVDSWFLCKTEMEEENAPMDLSRLSIREFLEQANKLACQHLAKSRKAAVTITRDTPLKETISRLVRHKVHGVYVVDDAGYPIGRVNVAHIVKALLVDKVGIFKRGENIANVFFWEKPATPNVPRPTVNDAVRRAAQRCAERREDSTTEHKDDGAASPVGPAPLRSAAAAPKLPVLGSPAPPAEYAAAAAQGRAGGDLARLALGNGPGRVLNLFMMQAVEQFLPPRLRRGGWRLAFSMQQHGGSTVAMKETLCASREPLVMALMDDKGYRFGGFLPSGLYLPRPSEDSGYQEGPQGDGESFVFTCGGPGSTTVRAFPWTGANRLFRFVNGASGLGMGGGGGGFAWFVDSFLNVGTSGPSDTYGNPCLASSADFRCVNVEAYSIATSLREIAQLEEEHAGKADALRQPPQWRH